MPPVTASVSDIEAVTAGHDAAPASEAGGRPSARQFQVLVISAVTVLGIIGYTVFAVLLLVKWRTFEPAPEVAIDPSTPIHTGADTSPSWGAVFCPLWCRDALALSFWLCHVMYVRGSRMASRHFYVVATISVVSVCMTAVFKVLLLRRLMAEEGSIRVVCLPLYVSCVVQFVLHWFKQVDQNGRRAGNAIELQNLIAVTAACKLDGVMDQGNMPWSTTLWPLWFALGAMGVFLMTTACILPTLCCLELPRHTVVFASTSFVMMLLMTLCSFIGCVRLVWWLDQFHPYPATAIMSPIIAACAIAMLLVCISTFFAYHFVQRSSAVEEPAEMSDDMLNLINQAVKPTHLIRQSETLYRRAAESTTADGGGKTEDTADVQLPQQQPATDLEMGAGGSPTCCICMMEDKAADGVFLECGHGGVCYDCALVCFHKQQQRKIHGCPICRQLITQVVRLGGEDETINGQVLVRVE